MVTRALCNVHIGRLRSIYHVEDRCRAFWRGPICSLGPSHELDEAALTIWHASTLGTAGVRELADAHQRAVTCPDCEGHGMSMPTVGMDNALFEHDCSACEGVGCFWPHATDGHPVHRGAR